MATALAELPASALADICATRPRISTRPLRPSEYYPPGTSRSSEIQTGVDADRIFNATVGQRSRILQQLEEAERDARDALFALEMMEMELAHENAAIQSTLSHLSETLSPREFKEMWDFAFDQSKKDWENVWKRKWVEDGTEREKFIKRPRGQTKRSRPNPRPSPPAPHVPSSPLPPSSPPPPTPPVNSRGRLPARTSPVPVNEVPRDEFQWLIPPLSPLPPDGFRAPWRFVDNFGSTGYRPTPPEPVPGPSRPQQANRLKRDKRRIEMRQDGSLFLYDPKEEIEAHRRQIREQMLLQAQQRFPAEAEISLWKIVRTEVSDRVQNPPVTWFRVFGDEACGETLEDELANPFAQDNHIPPIHPEHSSRPDQGKGEQEPESEANPHVQGDQ